MGHVSFEGEIWECWERIYGGGGRLGMNKRSMLVMPMLLRLPSPADEWIWEVECWAEPPQVQKEEDEVKEEQTEEDSEEDSDYEEEVEEEQAEEKEEQNEEIEEDAIYEEGVEEEQAEEDAVCEEGVEEEQKGEIEEEWVEEEPTGEDAVSEMTETATPGSAWEYEAPRPKLHHPGDKPRKPKAIESPLQLQVGKPWLFARLGVLMQPTL